MISSNPPLSALVTKPTDFTFEKNEQDWMPLFKKTPRDAWGNALINPFGENQLISAGPDGKLHSDDDLFYNKH